MVLHRVHDSLNESAVLAENQAVRAAGGARTLGFGRMVLQVPMSIYLNLQKLYPELRPGGDPRLRTWRWRKIAQDIDFQKLTVGKA